MTVGKEAATVNWRRLRRFHTIHMRLTAGFLGIMLIMFLVVQMLFHNYISYTRQAVMGKTRQTAQAVGTKIQDDVTYLKMLQMDWLIDRESIQTFSNGNTPTLNNLYEIFFQIRTHMNLLQFDSNVEGLYFYVANNGYLLTLLSASSQRQERKESVRRLLAEYAPSKAQSVVSHEGRLYLINPYFRRASSQGYSVALAFELSPEKWFDMLPQGCRAWFYDENSESIFPSHSASSGESMLLTARSVKSGADIVELDDESYAATSFSISGSSLWLHILNPLDETGILRIQRNFYTVFILAVAALLMLFAIMCVFMIRRPLQRLSDSFREVETGNYQCQIPEKGTVEIQQLNASFNHMTSTLRYLIEQKYEDKMLMNEAELKLLQSQINPHFLYNSFFLMNSLLEMEDYEQLKRLTENLGEYYQYMFLNVGGVKTLEQETSHARAYAEVQKMRFGNRITIRFDPVPEGWKDRTLPAMSIQPIIENAFQHGVSKTARPCRIDIRFEEEGDALRVVAANDALSLTEEEFSALQYQLVRPEVEENKSALCNIHRRMRIMYGAEGGLKLSRMNGEGFEVSFRIPRDK